MDSQPRIIVGNAWSEVEGGSRECIAALRNLLKYPLPQRKWALIHHLEADHGEHIRRRTFAEVWEYARHHNPTCPRCTWDWQVSLMKGRRFPTGLVSSIQKGFNAEIVDTRVRPEGFPVPHRVVLRDYQRAIVETAKKKGQGIIEVATGGGKTEMAIALSLELGLPTMIVVPTTAIFNEFTRRWPRYCDLPLGTIAGGNVDIQQVTVAIFDENWANSEVGRRLAAETQCLIVDEHHKSAAQTWQDYLLSVDAYFRFGQTATPFRESLVEHARLLAVTGPKIAAVDTRSLQENGYLTRAVVRMIAMRIADRSREWTEHYRRGIVHNPDRNGRIVAEALTAAGRGEKVLIIVNWDEHGQILREALGEEVVYFVGGTSSKKFNALKEEFLNSTNIAIGTPCVDLGFDVPVVDTLILAAGGKARGRTQQRLGRALRTAPDKDYATIIDFYDVDGGILWKHSLARRQTYIKLGQEVRDEAE